MPRSGLLTEVGYSSPAPLGHHTPAAPVVGDTGLKPVTSSMRTMKGGFRTFSPLSIRPWLAGLSRSRRMGLSAIRPPAYAPTAVDRQYPPIRPQRLGPAVTFGRCLSPQRWSPAIGSDRKTTVGDGPGGHVSEGVGVHGVRHQYRLGVDRGDVLEDPLTTAARDHQSREKV